MGATDTSPPAAEGAPDLFAKQPDNPKRNANDPHRTREPTTSRKKRRPIDIPHDPTENQLHQSIAELLEWILIPPNFFSTFPAGWGKLSKGTAGRLFASGLKKGMPDILVFATNSRIVGIELKVGHNGVSAAQRTMFAQLQAVGITVYVCRNQEDVLAALYRENVACRSINSRSADAGTNAGVASK